MSLVSAVVVAVGSGCSAEVESGQADVPSPQSEAFVIGALGALHDREESFDFDDLDQVVRGIDPDVILLEVTPDELSGRVDTRGRPEYPRVVWPLLDEPDAPIVYAMEAGQPVYGEITSEGQRILSGFAEQRPEEDAALQAWTETTEEVLLAHWSSPPETQDVTTDDVARARYALRSALIPGGQDLQTRWDSAMIEVVHRAVGEHPGARILVMGTFRNRFMFEQTLSEMSGVSVVDTPAWLEANGFGGR